MPARVLTLQCCAGGATTRADRGRPGANGDGEAEEHASGQRRRGRGAARRVAGPARHVAHGGVRRPQAEASPRDHPAQGLVGRVHVRCLRCTRSPKKGIGDGHFVVPVHTHVRLSNCVLDTVSQELISKYESQSKADKRKTSSERKKHTEEIEKVALIMVVLPAPMIVVHSSACYGRDSLCDQWRLDAFPGAWRPACAGGYT